MVALFITFILSLIVFFACKAGGFITLVVNSYCIYGEYYIYGQTFFMVFITFMGDNKCQPVRNSIEKCERFYKLRNDPSAPKLCWNVLTQLLFIIQAT